MLERTVEIETANGTMPVFITQPESGGPFAPVVLYMDIWGVREVLHDIARRIGTVGYAAMLPNLYYRKGGGNFDFRDAEGRSRSLKELAPAEQEEIYAVQRHLGDDMAVADSAALLAFLDTDESIRPGPVGSIGWCMGGRHVIRTAGAFPDRFVATASLHPTRMVGDDAPDAPYREAPKCRGELYIGWGELDHFAPPEVVAATQQTFRGQKVAYNDLVHIGAHHGYAIPDRDIFDKHAAARDWERIFAMYDRKLRQ